MLVKYTIVRVVVGGIDGEGEQNIPIDECCCWKARHDGWGCGSTKSQTGLL